MLNDWTRNAYIRLWYDEQTKMELLLYRPLTALNKTTVDANNTNDYSQITENQNRMQEIQQGLFDQRQPGEQYTIEDVNNFGMYLPMLYALLTRQLTMISIIVFVTNSEIFFFFFFSYEWIPCEQLLMPNIFPSV